MYWRIKMIYEYTIAGAGPAGIMAVVRALQNLRLQTKDGEAAKILAKQICWIDPQFNVGAFGQEWASVPGNTAASNYRAVYKEMYAILAAYGITQPRPVFDLDSEDANFPSLLKTAAEPLRWMTEQLQSLVRCVKSSADAIKSTPQGLEVSLGVSKIKTRRCILALGGKPKSLQLSSEDSSKQFPLELALNRDLLKDFIAKNPSMLNSTVLVQGSSHSAALAVWNLLDCGVKVKQIMNQPYRYYAKEKLSDGQIKVHYENTGLKGSVAQFTRQLEAGKVYAENWSCEIIHTNKSIDYSEYQHIVAAIGIEAVDSLSVNGISSGSLKYDLSTSETEVAGVFAVGVGHPPQAADGSKNVGLSKFWPDMGKQAIIWQKKPVKLTEVYRTDFFQARDNRLSSSHGSGDLGLVSRL